MKNIFKQFDKIHDSKELKGRVSKKKIISYVGKAKEIVKTLQQANADHAYGLKEVQEIQREITKLQYAIDADSSENTIATEKMEKRSKELAKILKRFEIRERKMKSDVERDTRKELSVIPILQAFQSSNERAKKKVAKRFKAERINPSRPIESE